MKPSRLFGIIAFFIINSNILKVPPTLSFRLMNDNQILTFFKHPVHTTVTEQAPVSGSPRAGCFPSQYAKWSV